MAKSKTATTAMAQQQAAMAGGGPWQSSITIGPNPNNYGGNYGGGGVNISPSWVPNASPNFHFSTTTIGSTARSTLEVFEELVGLIKQLEVKLSLDPKDKSKHAFLEMIMGRIQEETINNTIQRLKALKL